MTPEDEQRAQFITDQADQLVSAIAAGKHHQLQPHIDAVTGRYGADGLYVMMRVIAEDIAVGTGLRDQIDNLRRDPLLAGVNAEIYASFDMIGSGMEASSTSDPQQKYWRDAKTAAIRFVVAHVNNDTDNLVAMFRAAIQSGTVSMLMDGIIQYLRAELVAHGANTDAPQPERADGKAQIRTFVVTDGELTEITPTEPQP